MRSSACSRCSFSPRKQARPNVARVIKGGGAGTDRKNSQQPARVVVDGGGKRVIGGATYEAKQNAEAILTHAQQERQRRLAEGKKLAARTRDEAMHEGAKQAYAEAAHEALLSFKKRAEKYAAASDDIRVLALEIAKKIIGVAPELSGSAVQRAVKEAIAVSRAHRKLRVQIAPERWQSLKRKRPALWAALYKEPDIVVESDEDVGVGYARVVTEVSSTLCQEDDALNALSAVVGGGIPADEVRGASQESADDLVNDLDLFTDEGVLTKKPPRGPTRERG